ncbi:Nif3-like dinuclear metal center hexameric protein [Paenibacillus naphthalenovorans]|uniref:Nif3-like dinuclear metal center hexameric protein n=1 Tax=Paenibacillus naphthalenovorans TaxID=162209 RepID=UPI0008917576|nr:Nif3-like dinuclear metal center hexameric protein [Paenibacillus naphthalenovorans]SDJ78463.1 NIF3 (NGG1p interacting factor 3) [Paenibacillus naphthalenovorans]
MTAGKTGIAVADVLEALNRISKGRMVMDWNEVTSGTNPYVVMKTSNIPGKSVIEIPGLVFGDKHKPVARVGVGMTLTESVIELASAMKLDLIVVHHPVADAASSGGVPFADYLPLYDLALIEMHEAFHGLHPGMTLLHGHRKLTTDICFGGIPGNVLHKGIALPEVQTAGDILARINRMMGRDIDVDLLEAERAIRGETTLQEATLANPAKLLSGGPDSPVKHVLHFFPHTGFSVGHLETALRMYPETDTIIASISRVREDHPFVALARERGLTFIVGNSHSVEIMENGLPLAYALELLLPGIEVFLLRERITAVPLKDIAHSRMVEYGKQMAETHLVSMPPRAVQTY